MAKRRIITGKMMDSKCFDCIEEEPNLMVPWYILASYAYYQEDAPIISDQSFDRLTAMLLDSWSTVQHFHKKYLSREMLEAGTYSGKYPSRVPHAMFQLRRRDK